jgi:lysophospholipase L1-like esterase
MNGSASNRSFPSTPARAPGVFRILCVGDSLTFGQGVPWHQTLPAQLEWLLNRAVLNQPVEVINEGEYGFSLHHDRAMLLERLRVWRPDLCVLVVCNNDAELYPAGEGGRSYGEHVQDIWEESHEHVAYVRHLVASIKSECVRWDVRPVVVYYEMFNAAPPGRLLADICTEQGIDFLDLADQFTGENSASKNNALWVSTVDGHPSAYAHGIAARRLAQFLLKRGNVPDKADSLLDAAEPFGGAVEAGEQLRKSGGSTEFSLYRVAQWVRARQEGLEKRAALAGHTPPDARGWTESALSAMSVQRRALFWEAHAALLDRDLFWALAQSAGLLLRRIEMALFVYECNSECSNLRFLPFSHKPVTSQATHAWPLLFDVVSKKRQQLEVLQRAIEEPLPVVETPMLSYVADAAGRLDVARRTLREHWLEACTLADLQREMAQRVERYLKKIPPGPRSEDAVVAVRGLLALLSDLAGDLTRLFTVLPLAQPPGGWTTDERPVTRVAVHYGMDGAAGADSMFVSTTLKSRVPLWRTSETQMLVPCAGSAQFELPLFCLGRLNVRFFDPRAVLDHIEIWNRPDARVVIAPSQCAPADCGLETPELIVPA